MFQSLKFKLFVALATLVSLVVFGMGFGVHHLVQGTLMNQLQDQLFHRRDVIKAVIEGRMHRSVQSCIKLSTQEKIARFSRGPATRQALQDFLDYNSVFYNVYLFDASGQVRFVKYRDGRNVKKYLALNYNSFKTDFPKIAALAQSSKIGAYAPAFYSRPEHLILPYLHPIIWKGEVKGLVSAAIEVNDQEISGLLDRLNVENGYIAIEDENGRHFASTGVMPETKISSSLVSGKLVQRGGFLVLQSSLKELKMRIIVGHSVVPMNVRLKQLRLGIIFLGVFAILISLWISFALANSLTRPIQRLIYGLNQARQGRYDFKVPSDGDSGQVGAAIEAYNEMIQDFQRQGFIHEQWVSLTEETEDQE